MVSPFYLLNVSDAHWITLILLWPSSNSLRSSAISAGFQTRTSTCLKESHNTQKKKKHPIPQSKTKRTSTQIPAVSFSLRAHLTASSPSDFWLICAVWFAGMCSCRIKSFLSSTWEQREEKLSWTGITLPGLWFLLHKNNLIVTVLGSLH